LLSAATAAPAWTDANLSWDPTNHFLAWGNGAAHFGSLGAFSNIPAIALGLGSAAAVAGTNYVIASDGTSTTYLNVPGGGTALDLRFNNSSLATFTSGKLTKYNNLTTAGQGVPPIMATIHQTAQTAAIATATLCAAANCGNGSNGQYHIHINAWGSGTACGTPGAGGITPSITYTDENAVTHSALVLPLIAQTGAASMALQSAAPTMPFQSALANESATGDINISTNGTIIQYAVAYAACGAGTGTYNIDIAVTELQ
jgi:hypothetical protein